MARTNLGFSDVTGTMIRVRYEDAQQHGICPICLEDCPILCTVGKAALRGREVLYPKPEYFGKSVAGSNKIFGLDWADIQIMSDVRKEATFPEEFRDPDKAIFEAVDITSQLGFKHPIKLRVPVTIAALGSTKVAAKNAEHIYGGAALAGILTVIGENVCGMDPNSIVSNGKIQDSPDMKRRVEAFRKWWDGEYGDIAVQTNVEDQRLGVDIYAITKLEVNVIERKWGQGAKSIGGEVRIFDLDRAIMLRKRGYIVIPDPLDPAVQEAFKAGIIKSFERHSRLGMPTIEGFVEDVEKLREQGAKVVGLKMGQYRPAVIVWSLKAASEAKLDYVTFDGQPGGTGMSPWPMMLEQGVPTTYMEAIVLNAAYRLWKKGKHVPHIQIAGGFICPTQIFKAIALSKWPGGPGPFVKAIAMAKPILTAVFKAKLFAEWAEKGELAKRNPAFAKVYGTKVEEIFEVYHELKHKYGDKVKEIPYGAIGVYSYVVEYIGVGLKQLMAGSRRFKLDLLDRSLLAALTPLAKEVFGLPMIHELDKDVIDAILES